MGQFTEGFDVVDALVAAFAIGFLALVFYLRREDKREGYGVSGERTRSGLIGWPAPPPPKTYRLMDGGTVTLPKRHAEPEIPPGAIANGAAFAPPGDALLSGLGPASAAQRSDLPMLALDGLPILRPLRLATDWRVRRRDADPRGMRVVGRDFQPAGHVTDLWVDRVAMILRYFEVTLSGGDRTVLVPIFHCDIDRPEREIRVLVLPADQLGLAPRLADPDLITARDEDRVNAFFAGATLYAREA